MIQHGERCFSLLTSLYSLLAFGRSGLVGPPLCGGSAPATPPPKTPAAPSEWQIDLDDPLRPGLTPHPTPRLGRFPVCASAGKVERQRPIRPNRHRYGHQEPATETLTVNSPQADRTMHTHTEHGLVVTTKTKTGFKPVSSPGCRFQTTQHGLHHHR